MTQTTPVGKLPRTVPFGRLGELRARPDSDLIAYSFGGGLMGDARVKVYASRAALEAFCKPGSNHHALIKHGVAARLLTNRNTERAIWPPASP